MEPPYIFLLEGAATRQAFALSPDGSRLAFTAMGAGGEFSVFVRDFNSLESRRVPGAEAPIPFSGHRWAVALSDRQEQTLANAASR
jgi:hypothetical protein